MTPPQTKEFCVSIVGGGVCGLTCAIALAREGVPVDIFESASKFSEIGAGLGLGPNAIRVLRALGIYDNVLARSTDKGTNMNSYRFISGTGGHEVLYDNPLAPEDRGIGVMRYDFLNALVDHLDMGRAHFNKRCTGVVQSSTGSRLTMYFSDGSTHETDLVIGADGIRSSVRSAITGQASDANLAFSNTIAYRTLIPWDEVKHKGLKTDLTLGMTCFAGKGKHVIVYPIQGGQIINTIGFVTNMVDELPVGNGHMPPGERWVCDAPAEELRGNFREFGSDIQKLFSCVRNTSRWSIHHVYPPLRSYVRGKIALIGDSAHAMRTHLGAGAGQGLEDCYVLAKLLGHPSADVNNLEEILQEYDEIRRPRAQRVWERTVMTGEIYEGRGPSGFTPEGFTKDLTGNWLYVWHHDLDADIQAAIHRLQNDGIF